MIRQTMALPRALTVLGLVLPLLLLPAHAGAAGKKHHLGLALGYQKLLSDDLKDDFTGVDFTDSGYGAMAYRLSVSPALDVTFDVRATVSTQTIDFVDVTVTNSFVGPGIRLTSQSGGVRPYVQANFFFVDEQVDAEAGDVTVSGSDNGAGFGVCGGVDIRASNLLSVPIEVNYMYGKPADDVSGVGINVGLTFNFGTLSR